MTGLQETYRSRVRLGPGGCTRKSAPGELEEVVRGLTGQVPPDLLVGLGDGDDAAVVRIDDAPPVVANADFFSPVVDRAYDWGRIAAGHALSDVYAMGGRPVVAVNLVGWLREKLRKDLLTEVLRGGNDVAREAASFVAGRCCSPTRRPAAARWSSARSRATRSSARSSPGATRSSRC